MKNKGIGTAKYNRYLILSFENFQVLIRLIIIPKFFLLKIITIPIIFCKKRICKIILNYKPLQRNKNILLG